MSIFDLFLDKAPDDRMKNVRQAYRRVFLSRDGRVVLTHMLSELHFFDEVVGDQEIALSNYGRRILYNLGALDPKNLADQSMVDALLAIPLKDTGGVSVRRNQEGRDMIESKENV
jgi:hypothetical protein